MRNNPGQQHTDDQKDSEKEMLCLSDAGNRTPISCVKDRYDSRYTTSEGVENC
ncbi:uncharacterized protein BP01DRAFT_358481, partial [Aspergillus saccharolyticus JOP 1030-1]